MRSVVRPKAEANLYAAASWYQDEEPGSSLWMDLLDEFESVVAYVREHPLSIPIYEGNVRRALLKRFPYAIYYVVEPEEIVVVTFLAMLELIRLKQIIIAQEAAFGEIEVSRAPEPAPLASSSAADIPTPAPEPTTQPQ